MSNIQPQNLYFAQFREMWKKTQKKKYEIWCTIAAPGITITDYNTGLTQTTDCNNFVVLSDLFGEKRIITWNQLRYSYRFATGEEITVDSIIRHIKRGLDGWIKITEKDMHSIEYAIFLSKTKFKNIPITTETGEIKLANVPGATNGDGDYLVCKSFFDGSPDFLRMNVVNGIEFVSTYNIQSFNILPHMKQKIIKKAPQPRSIKLENSQLEQRLFEALKRYHAQNANPWTVMSTHRCDSDKLLRIRMETEEHVVLKRYDSSNVYYIVFKDLTYGVVFEPHQMNRDGSVNYLGKKIKANSVSHIEAILRVEWGINVNMIY